MYDRLLLSILNQAYPPCTTRVVDKICRDPVTINKGKKGYETSSCLPEDFVFDFLLLYSMHSFIHIR